MFDVGAYRYQCIDHSLLDPYLRLFFAKPLHKLIPKWLPANCISLLGHACVWSVFLIATHKPSLTVIFCCLFLLQSYMVLDVLDGMQARVTQTSSPLGEYIDHGGDAYNCGLIIYASLTLLNVTTTWFYYVLIGLGLVIFSLVSLEKKTTGYCVFPNIGNVELQTFLVLFFSALQIPSIGTSLAVHYYGLSMSTWILLSIAIIGGALSIRNSLKRITKLPAPYYIFLILSGSLILTLTLQNVPCSLSVLILVFFMATYNSEILFSHLTQQEVPWPDKISGLIIVFLMIMTYLNYGVQQDVFYALLAYFIFKAFLRISHVLGHYRQFWVWINPRFKTIG